MTVLRSERLEAVAEYESLGLDVFPYDKRGMPFRDWPNPWHAMTRKPLVLDMKTAVFGVNLSGYIVCIDIDTDRGGSLESLEEEYGPLPPTMTVTTPSGERNLHLYFRSSTLLRTNKELTKRFPHIDFLGRGSNVKGFTSWRRIDFREASPDSVIAEPSYKRQRPYLDPAPLPIRLQEDWKRTMAGSDPEVVEYTLADHPVEWVPLTQAEKKLVTKWIADDLEAIRAAGAGERWDVFGRCALSVIRNGALLHGDIEVYDDEIRDAYLESGGLDPWVEEALRATKAFAAAHPRLGIDVQAYKASKNPALAEWAGLALKLTNTRNKVRQKLIRAIAAESSDDLALTEAWEHLNRKYGIGEDKNVLRAKASLVKDGLLAEAESTTTRNGYVVTYHLVTKPRGASL